MIKKNPKVVILPLTYRCNAKCIMCDIWKNAKQEELSYNDLKVFFEDPLIKQNLLSVNLTGGEPVLRNDLVGIVEMILTMCNNLQIITINTNGFFTEKYKELVKRLCMLKQTVRDYKLMFYLSLDGLSEIHNKVRGIAGFFEHVMDTIDLFEKMQKNLDFSYSINFTISKTNYMEMDNVYNYVTSKGIMIDFTYGMESSTYFGNKNNKNIGMNDEESKTYICNRLLRYMEQQGKLSYSKTYYKNLIDMIHGKERKVGCIFTDEGIFLHPSGDVYRCWAYNKKMGNILERPISVIWNENNSQEDYKQIKEKCSKCYNNCYVNFKRIDSIKRLLSKE